VALKQAAGSTHWGFSVCSSSSSSSSSNNSSSSSAQLSQHVGTEGLALYRCMFASRAVVWCQQCVPPAQHAPWHAGTGQGRLLCLLFAVSSVGPAVLLGSLLKPAAPAVSHHSSELVKSSPIGEVGAMSAMTHNSSKPSAVATTCQQYWHVSVLYRIQ
jgi:hypothetical protein